GADRQRQQDRDHALMTDDVLALGPERELFALTQGSNCSLRIRSSRSCSGSNSTVSSISFASVTATLTTFAISTESAAAAIGRFLCSSTVNSTLASRGSNAPRQRRGRKALIGVRARRPAPSGRIGP